MLFKRLSSRLIYRFVYRWSRLKWRLTTTWMLLFFVMACLTLVSRCFRCNICFAPEPPVVGYKTCSASVLALASQHTTLRQAGLSPPRRSTPAFLTGRHQSMVPCKPLTVGFSRTQIPLLAGGSTRTSENPGPYRVRSNSDEQLCFYCEYMNVCFQT